MYFKLFLNTSFKLQETVSEVKEFVIVGLI